MRTTLTLDDDVAEKVKALAERNQSSFKQTVNELLRRGLAAQDRRSPRTKRFRVDTFQSEFRPGVDPLKLNQLADEIEVEHAIDRIHRRGGA